MRMRNLLRPAIAAVVMSASLATMASPAPANAATAECWNPSDSRTFKEKQYIFIGARGSGESKTSYYGMGSRVWKAWQAVKNDPKYRGKVACVAVNPNVYPALAVPKGFDKMEWDTYIDEVIGGYPYMNTQAAYLAKRFPKSKFIFAGYSQGAALTHITTSKWAASSTLRGKVEGSILIADPLAGATDRRMSFPNAAKEWTGPSQPGVLSFARAATSNNFGNFQIWTTVALANVLLKRVPFCLGIPLCKKVKNAVKTANDFKTMAADLHAYENTPALSGLLTASQIARKGIPVASVCYSGDIVCAPIGKMSKQSFARISVTYPSGGFSDSIHSNKYQIDYRWASPTARYIATH
ncbi:cutinase family protein [Nocardioides sp. GY 10113]|uniref:cutinase family protein n=1 Tax=Nocardioides sp. GY 10113 TaxID=2569761 RepID=UPI0010A81102|nr:cutinase family protein [Nocardioides sp. GY 10113]TIC82205.1 cutinase family protein [Nocardioides sp. GY 10113]